MFKEHAYGKGVSGFDQTFGFRMRQFVPTLIHMAQLAPGQRVLDIATGTGNAAAAALDIIGPAGHVTAADDTPLMLASRLPSNMRPHSHFQMPAWMPFYAAWL
jgi:protein-L-isoaspartate O-methyltransferase